MGAIENIIVCHHCCKRQGANCAVSGKPFNVHAEEHTCPKARFKSRGVGDTIEKVLHWTGAGKVLKAIAGEDCGCTGEGSRRERLNDIAPYASKEGAD